jgi:hypothetical protein
MRYPDGGGLTAQGRMRNDKLPTLAEALSGMRLALSTRMPLRPCCALLTS